MLGVLFIGCAERPSASSTESAASTDSLEARGAAKRAATWQAARRRGVQFRAIGQEPGWLVEVTADSLQVEWKYGQQMASGPRAEVGAAPSNAPLRYVAETEEGPVQVKAVERRCVDPMNGDAFPLTVTVRVAADTLAGCGRLLQQ
jgi:uncharacterized membrane protein